MVEKYFRHWIGKMTRERAGAFLEGCFHRSPPFFLPGMRESYRKVE